jgi:isoleucyl-tRNA synthetase
MKGFRVARKAGWDTHGLPVEIEVEKALGISGKQQIEEIGVARFNELSRESVWRYRGDWEKLSQRIGYWLDYEHPYVTYSHDYVESVWWALATLHERDLLYRGHRVLPYCPRCGTALSSHEVAQGYKDVSDPSLYIALDITDADGPVARRDDGRSLRRVLVWTTTPWTLVSNTALAVNADLRYVELRRKQGDQRTVLPCSARTGRRGGMRSRASKDRRWPAGATRARSTGSPTRLTASTKWSSSRASSRRATEQEWCTCRRRSAPTTTRRGSATGSPSCSR